MTPPSLKTTDPTILALAWLGCNVPIDEFTVIDKRKLVEVSGLDECLVEPMLVELAYQHALVRKPTPDGYVFQRRPLINSISSSLVLKGTKTRYEGGGVEPGDFVGKSRRQLRVPPTNTGECLINRLEETYPIQEKLSPVPETVGNSIQTTVELPAAPALTFVSTVEPSTSLATIAEVPSPALPMVALPADLTKYGFTVNGSSIIWCDGKADMRDRVNGYLEIDGSVEIDLVKRVGKVVRQPQVILDETA